MKERPDGYDAVVPAQPITQAEIKEIRKSISNSHIPRITFLSKGNYTEYVRKWMDSFHRDKRFKLMWKNNKSSDPMWTQHVWIFEHDAYHLIRWGPEWMYEALV